MFGVRAKPFKSAKNKTDPSSSQILIMATNNMEHATEIAVYIISVFDRISSNDKLALSSILSFYFLLCTFNKYRNNWISLKC